MVALPAPISNANRAKNILHAWLGSRWLWLGMAVLVGIAVAALPLQASLLQASLLTVAVLAGGICLLIEPLNAVAIAVVFGLFRALLAQRQAWIPDLGQVGFVLILAVYTLRTLATRRTPLPRTAIQALLPLILPALLWLSIATLSLWGADDLPNGIKELLKWSQTLLLMALLTGEIAQHPRKVWYVLGIALLAGLVQAGWGIYQFVLRGHGPEHFFISPGLYRAYGSFHQPNPYGGFLGMAWTLAAGVAFGFATSALTRIWKSRSLFLTRQTIQELLAMLAFAAIAGILLVGLFASYSRGAWLGAVGAVACMAFFGYVTQFRTTQPIPNTAGNCSFFLKEQSANLTRVEYNHFTCLPAIDWLSQPTKLCLNPYCTIPNTAPTPCLALRGLCNKFGMICYSRTGESILRRCGRTFQPFCHSIPLITALGLVSYPSA